MINIVAEIGGNHMGSIDTALRMIKTAKEFCHCYAVKFQKRCNPCLLTEKEYNEAHPVPENAFGSTYGAHREYLEFDSDSHKDLKTYCDSLGIVYSTSVWDVVSAQEIVELHPEYIKVPSATNLNFQVLSLLVDSYDGDVHLSLGMTTRKEEERIVNYFTKKNALGRLVIYACTAGYPVEHEELYLLEISRLKQEYGSDAKGIGFSGHHKGIAADVAAVSLGATWIERHFTLDRTWKGTDHAASLEPDGMRRLVRDTVLVSEALDYKPLDSLIVTEQKSREKLKRPMELLE